VKVRSKPRRSWTPPLAYRRVLVPLALVKGSEQAMRIACELAAERGSSVTAVTVIEVPAELPLDSHMIDEESRAQDLLGRAQDMGDLYGVGVAVRVLRARHAGEAIVDEASRSRSEIVVLRAPRKRRVRTRAPIFGRNVHFVLKHATCRVMVAAAPPGA
jgi:basic amino acid/polyamine antiporter, APA family